MNLLLHGLDAPQIDPGNALRLKLTDIGERDRVDVILTKGPEIRAELYMDGPKAKAEFAALEKQKDAIEGALGFPLKWHNPENKAMCRLATRKDADFSTKHSSPAFRVVTTAPGNHAQGVRANREEEE